MKAKVKSVYNMTPVLKDALLTRLATPVKPLALQKKIMSPQQWKFVQELCSGDGGVTLKEAAIRAGYSPETARETARRLTDPQKMPHVVAAIQEFRVELAERYGTNFERHMRDLQKIRDAALEAGNFGAAVTAEYRRGQALGTIYIERKEIRIGLIDSMSKEEVMRRLTEIQQIYGGAGVPAIDHGSIIDMTPEEIAIARTPPPTVAEEMKADELERRIAAEEARRERKRQHGRALLTKIHGAEKAALLRPDLFEAGRIRDDDDQGDADGERGADAGGGGVPSEDDDEQVSDVHFDPDAPSGDDEDFAG
jgi:phage terminase small subunit